MLAATLDSRWQWLEVVREGAKEREKEQEREREEEEKEKEEEDGRL